MPAGDGTGPNGQGSMTGRGAGYCAVPLDELQANNNPSGTFFGRRRSMRNGMARGFRRGRRTGFGLARRRTW